MMIFTSIYGIVDGYFISNHAGKDPFTAANLIIPFLMIVSTVGFMFGTGGSAIVAKTMGEGDYKKANESFSLFIYVTFALGVAVAVLGIIFLRPIAILMGAEGEILEYCIVYARIILFSQPFYMLQMAFQSFFVAAEKPKLGLVVTVISGVTNMVLDALLLGVFHMGIAGAAIATAACQFIGGGVSLLYFILPNSSLLRLGKTSFNLKLITRASINGSSEFMSNISMSLVSILYNLQLIKYAGNNGVAAYGVIMYVGFIFIAVFVGYSIGVAPIVGFNDGADNRDELKGVFKKSLVIISIISVSMCIMSFAVSRPFSSLFVGYDAELMSLTARAFTIYSFVFLFAGFAIFSSGFFTALNNGVVSAIISFMRTLVFQIIAVMVLPLFLGTDGIWASVIVAELMATILSVFFLIIKRKKYRYI